MKLRNLLTENTTTVFEQTKEGIAELGAFLKANVKVPILNVSAGSFGDFEIAYLTICFDEKKDWPNRIFHNSRHGTFTVESSGVVECHSLSLSVKSTNPMRAYDRAPIKFRKTKIKNQNELAAKLQKFVNEVEAFYSTLDPKEWR